MTEAILENGLRAFDFSQFSKVKDSLLDELLKRHRLKNFKSLSQQLAELTEEELDYVAAAGKEIFDDKQKTLKKFMT